MNYAAHHIGALLRALVYIDEHLDEPLQLERVAKLAYISPFYFHRLFHAYVGKTLAEYVTDLRLQRAQEHLSYSDKPITEIALDLGYQTPSSFTKVFNQVLGTSPREYRKKMQPLLELMIARTSPTKEQKEMLRPKYVTRREMPVLFVRRVGDYIVTPLDAYKALTQFLEESSIKKDDIGSFYSMGLDDPQIVERSKCRFDMCVRVHVDLKPKGEVGQKILPGGRYVLFIHRGHYSKIEDSLRAIFRCWYPSSHLELGDAPPICEMADDAIKLYIPIKGNK